MSYCFIACVWSQICPSWVRWSRLGCSECVSKSSWLINGLYVASIIWQKAWNWGWCSLCNPFWREGLPSTQLSWSFLESSFAPFVSQSQPPVTFSSYLSGSVEMYFLLKLRLYLFQEWPFNYKVFFQKRVRAKDTPDVVKFGVDCNCAVRDEWGGPCGRPPFRCMEEDTRLFSSYHVEGSLAVWTVAEQAMYHTQHHGSLHCSKCSLGSLEIIKMLLCRI